MATYFITGATGTVGREIVSNLLAQGHHVKAASRQPQQQEQLFDEQVELVQFDFENPDTYSAALQSEGIFLLGPPMYPDLFKLIAPFVDYLQANQAPRLVYLSALGMEHLESLPFHQQMEEKLKQSKLDYYIVRPSFFMQNFGNYERENIETRQVVFLPAGQGKVGFISTRDIGASVAALLQGKQFDKRIYELTGEQALDHFEAAALLSEATGKTITYANPDASTYRKVLLDAQVPAFVADYMIPIYGLIKDNKVEQTTDDVKTLTGQTPESLETVLARDFS